MAYQFQFLDLLARGIPSLVWMSWIPSALDDFASIYLLRSADFDFLIQGSNRFKKNKIKQLVLVTPSRSGRTTLWVAYFVLNSWKALSKSKADGPNPAFTTAAFRDAFACAPKKLGIQNLKKNKKIEN